MKQFEQVIEAALKVIEEMPDFTRSSTGRYVDAEGQSIKKYDVEVLGDNVVHIYQEKGGFMIPSGFFATYFMIDEQSAQDMGEGEINYPLIVGGSLNRQSNFPDIWRKADKRVIGLAQGSVTSDKIYVDFMTVRSKARRNYVNTTIIKETQKAHPGKEVVFLDVTKDGSKFAGKYGGSVEKSDG